MDDYLLAMCFDDVWTSSSIYKLSIFCIVNLSWAKNYSNLVDMKHFIQIYFLSKMSWDFILSILFDIEIILSYYPEIGSFHLELLKAIPLKILYMNRLVGSLMFCLKNTSVNLLFLKEPCMDCLFTFNSRRSEQTASFNFW